MRTVHLAEPHHPQIPVLINPLKLADTSREDAEIVWGEKEEDPGLKFRRKTEERDGEVQTKGTIGKGIEWSRYHVKTAIGMGLRSGWIRTR